MMRLNKLTIEEFRGIRCTELKFSDNGVLIYGPNGVGKSSTLIALEYLLSGDVSRLTGRGAGRKSLEHDLVHKKADSREDSKVTAEFSHQGNSVKIRRCVADGELEVLSPKSDTPMALAELTSAVGDQRNTLSRQELLHFINATDSDRSEALNTILRIDNIDEYRMTLQRAHKNISNKLGESKDDLNGSQKDFYAELEDGIKKLPTGSSQMIASETSAIEAINKLRAYYDADPLSELDDGEFTVDIREPAQPIQHPLASTATTSKLDKINQFSAALDDLILTPLEELHEGVETLNTGAELRRDVEAQNLLEQGDAIVTHDSTQCPLCLSEYDGTELLELINERQNNATEAKNLQEHIQEQQQSIEDTLKQVLTLVDQICRDLDTQLPDGAESLSSYTKTLSQFSENLALFDEKFNSGGLLEVPYVNDSPAAIRDSLLPDELDVAVTELLEISDSVGEPEDQFAAYGHLNRAEIRFEQYLDDERTAERLDKQKQIAKHIESEFQTVRKNLLNETLEEIRIQFNEIIDLAASELILQEDYKLESTDTGIEFRVPFHDGSTQRPNQIFSEGQQDIIGLSLFLAMANIGCVNSVELILLDDVLSSVDAEHRSHVARILDSELGERFQFILTTHDLVWSRHLRQTSHIDSNNVVHFSGWSYEAGVHRHHDITDPQQNIDFHLRNNDLTAAAAWGRKTAEFYASKGCEKLAVDVPYRKIEKLSLSDYLHALMPELTNILSEGEVDEDTVYNEETQENMVEKFASIQTFIDQNHWGMNKNVHYSEPEFASYSEVELRENLNILEDLADVLYCSCCDTWRTDRDEGFQCDCSMLVKSS